MYFREDGIGVKLPGGSITCYFPHLKLIEKEERAMIRPNRFISRRFSSGIAVILMVVLIWGMMGCFGLSQVAAQDKVVKIGCIWPLTGDLAAYGAANKRALELAAEIINNAYSDLNLPFAATKGLPNLGGAQIKLVWGIAEEHPKKVGLRQNT